MTCIVTRPWAKVPSFGSATLLLLVVTHLAIGCSDATAPAPPGTDTTPATTPTAGPATAPATGPTNGSTTGPTGTDAVVSAGSPARIVFLGDSISAGYGLSAGEAFPALVEQALRDAGVAVDVLNAGVSGDTSAGGLSRLDWVLQGAPDVLVIELGGNDALRGQPLENTENNLREIITGARAAGARVLLLGMDVPTNYGVEYAGGFAALYPRIAADLDVAIVPGFIREVGLDPALMQPDGLHPTAAGHRRLSESLLVSLQKLLAGSNF